MKIVADENVDKQVVERLRFAGHDVVFIAELAPGIDDEAVLRLSREANAVLLTADKDFGKLIFRRRLLHAGVLLIRLAGTEPGPKAELVAIAFANNTAMSCEPCLEFYPVVRFGCASRLI